MNLVAAIYLLNFIKTKYVSLEDENLIKNLQEATLNSFLNHKNIKVKNQLIVIINRMIITDFKDSLLLRLLLDTFRIDYLNSHLL